MKIIVIFNFGQYNHLISRTLTYLGVDAPLIPNSVSVEEIRRMNPDGIVIGGGPSLERAGNSPKIVEEMHEEVPILGICLGHQLIAKVFGGEVRRGRAGEYSEVEIVVDDPDLLFRNLPRRFKAWASHMDEVSRLPDGFEILAHSEVCEIEAMKHKEYPLFGVQFHPEVHHTPLGPDIFRNFMKVCEEWRS